MVEILEPNEDYDIPEEGWVANHIHVVVGCEHLVAYDMPTNPFDCEDIEEHDQYIFDDYYLRECEVSWLMTCYPECAYEDWSDPVVFTQDGCHTKLNGLNNLYTACWYAHKFEQNRKGCC